MPTLQLSLVGTDGKFHNQEMVELSRCKGGTALFKWLFGPLVFTHEDWSHGLPWKLPLLMELKSGLKNPGGPWKRGRDGKLRDDKGNLMSEVTTLQVRGREVRLHNIRLHDAKGHLRFILG